MARKKTSPPASRGAKADTKAVKTAMKAAEDEGRRLNIIESEYGDGTPFDLEKSVALCRLYVASSAEAMLLLGRELVRIKEHVPHGEFRTVVEERLGLGYNTVRRSMQAAVKFLGGQNDRRRSFLQRSNLGPTKLLELLTEDDDDLDALAEGGTLAGHTLDEIDRMSTRELRAALRKEREQRQKDASTSEKLIERKDKKINELDRKLSTQEQQRTEGWRPAAFRVNVEITECAADALQAFDRLEQLSQSILTDESFEGEERAFQAMAECYYDAVAKLQVHANNLLAACQENFMGYQETARPLLDQTDLFGDDAKAAAAGGAD